MALTPQDILATTRQTLATGNPVSAFFQGASGAVGLQQQALQNEQLQQQIAQAATMAPLEQQAQELLIRQRQEALSELGVPNETVAEQLAFDAAQLKALPEDLRMEKAQNIRQAAISQGRTTNNIDEYISFLESDPSHADQILEASLAGFKQLGLLGVDEEQRAAREAIAKKEEKDLKLEIEAEKTQFDQAAKLRSEISKASSEFDKVDSAYGRVEASVEDPSPAGDLALIFNFMKMLDPGSVVREGEFANASNAGGIDSKVRNLYNSVMEGTRLTPSQRKDFVGRAGKLFKRASNDNKKDIDKFVSIGREFGITRQNLLGDEKVQSQGQAKQSANQFTSSSGIKFTVE